MYARITVWNESAAPAELINALMFYAEMAYTDYDDGLDCPVAVYYLKNPMWDTVDVFTAALTEAGVEFSLGVTDSISFPANANY